MNNDNFEKLMSEHTDEKLIDVLKNRKEYQEAAVEAAIKVAIHRNLINDYNEIEDKFPTSENKSEKSLKELRIFGKKIDFQKGVNVLYLIGVGTSLVVGFYLHTIPIVPLIYIGLVFYCSKYYNNTLANIIIWVAAFQIVAVALFILSFLIQLFL